MGAAPYEPIVEITKGVHAALVEALFERDRSGDSIRQSWEYLSILGVRRPPSAP